MRGYVYMQKSPIIRCTHCGLRSYELSTSDYVRRVGAIVEEWSENYALEDGVWEAIAEELSAIKDDCEESLENIPYELQDGEVGTLLQERIESLDDCISQLTDYADMNDFLSQAYDDLSEEEQEAVDREREALEAAGKDSEYTDFHEAFWERRFTAKLTEEEKAVAENAAEAWKENFEETVSSFIEEAVGELSY